MQQIDAKHLFQMQADLIDSKVELSVNKAIQQVVTQIIDLKQEMHHEMSGLRGEVHELGNRLSSVETALGMRNQIRGEVRTRFFDYAFKAGWLLLGSALTYLVIHSHTIFQ